MPKIALTNMQGANVGEIELSDGIFAVPMNEPVVHQVIVAQLANKRQGTQSALGRTEVSGGGKKPYRQKGTGHARQGSTRAPQWTHGGVVFAPKPRDYSKSVPRKVKRLAMKCALSSKVCLEQQHAYYTSPAFNGSSTARDQVGALLTAALSKADNGNLDALLNTLFADAVEECEYNS